MPTAPHQHTEVVPSAADLTRVACELILGAAALSIARRGCFRIALSGGSTPRPIYASLASNPNIDWKRWHLFWSDERTVPPDDPESNYGMVNQVLLSKLSVRPGLVVRMPGELEPVRGADAYAQSILELVPPNDERSSGHLPRFDMILLGMGADGHTASLFPHTAALNETERLVVANPVPQLDSTRLTMTIPLINAARRVLFLVSGLEKAATLREVLSGEYRPMDLPSQSIHPVAGNLIWLADEAAFSALQMEMDD